MRRAESRQNPQIIDFSQKKSVKTRMEIHSFRLQLGAGVGVVEIPRWRMFVNTLS